MHPPQLLDDTDPPPARVLCPDGGSDFFLTADHAGRAIPRRLGDLGVPESEWERHIAWDIGIAAVTERLSRALDATAVLQTYSRLLIDCNRRPDWDSAIPTLSEHTPIPGNRDLSDAEREARRREIFDPGVKLCIAIRTVRRSEAVRRSSREAICR
jgi:predicted N-formylglutamate amidohydrolase